MVVVLFGVYRIFVHLKVKLSMSGFEGQKLHGHNIVL